MSAPTDTPQETNSTLGTPELKRWVDAYVNGGCSAATLNRSLTALCRDNPGAASDALSLLVHYDERGQLRLRNLELLRMRLESAARGEPMVSPDVAASPDISHESQATELLPVLDTASATVLLPVAGASAMTEVMPADLLPEQGAMPRSRNVAHPGIALRATAPSPRTPTRRPIGTGSVLRDRFVLGDALGSGGMGTVYRALDRNRLDLAYECRHVALKVLRDEYSRRPEAVAALRREFLQAQSLTHPGLVKVFDFDRDGDTHFITMELLDGELLAALLERLRPGKLPRDDARRILAALGSAVAHAHDHGVLHLDLKPGNVMITARGEVRVLDFGLAHPHVREPWISDGPPAFHAATPTYASCERIAGTSPDPRDDVFSLACIAYELLSGEHPFNRSSAREARDEGLKVRRIRGLSRREWQTLSRGLAWTREDRTRTVVELLDGLGLELAPPRAPAKSRPPRAGERTSGFLGALLVAGLAAVAVVAYLQRERWLPAIVGLATAPTSTSTTGPVQVAEPDPVAAAAATSTQVEIQAEPASEADAVSDAATDPGMAGAADSAVDAEPTPGADRAQPEATAAAPESIPTVTQPEPAPAPAEAVAEKVAATAPAAAMPRRRGRVQLATDSLTVSESEPAARVKVRRVGGSDGRLSFLWRTDGHSATGDKDYAELGWNEEVLASGQVTTTLLVPIVADQQREHTELFDVVLGSTEDETALGAITSTTIIIVDDD